MLCCNNFLKPLKIKIVSHQQNKQLMEALNNCTAECNQCATACLDEQDVKMLAKCIKLDIDCAGICTLTATLIARGSEHGRHLLKECAEVCNACAEECENIHIWNIVKNAQRLAGNVHKNVKIL